jgi:hypothetical protein
MDRSGIEVRCAVVTGDNISGGSDSMASRWSKAFVIRLVVYLRVAGRATLIRDLLRVDTSVMLNSILVDSFAINGARTRFGSIPETS